MRYSTVLALFVLASSALAVCSGKMMGMKSKKPRKGKGMRMMCMMKYKELQEHYTSLQTRVDSLSNPVHVHVHGLTNGEDDVIMSHSHPQRDREHNHEHKHSHGKNMSHTHEHMHGHHHSERMTKSENLKGEDPMEGESSNNAEEEEDEDDSSSEEMDDDDSGSNSEDSDSGSSGSSEDRDDKRGRKGKGTHVHIHLNLGAEVAEMLAKSHGKSSMKQGDRGKVEAMKISMDYPEEYSFARCDMMRNSASTTAHNVRGPVYLRQKPGQPLEVTLDLYGFDVRNIRNNQEDPRHLHGFHVHQFGDFSNGCNSFGGHYNPTGHDHGGPDDHHRHAGDWGNIECDHRGVARIRFNETSSTLFGAHSIIGRGMVIHERADDLGTGHSAASKASGDAGGRIACCVVTWAKGVW